MCQLVELMLSQCRRTASIVGADDASYQQPRGSMMRVESFYGARASAVSPKAWLEHCSAQS